MTIQITSLADFDRVHRNVNRRLDEYAHLQKSNYVHVPPDVQTAIRGDQSGSKSAANILFRINIAKTVVATLEQMPGLAEGGKLFYVTVASREFAVPYEQARDFDIRPFRKAFRRSLARTNAIGMIEAGLFTRVGQNLPVSRQKLLVSWHGHALVWGISEKTLRKRLNKEFGDHTNLRGKSAIHVKAVPRGDRERQAIYAFKAPIKGYTLGASEGEKVNPLTGEITPLDVFHRKHDLRSGDLARMAIVLADRSAYELMICTGEGIQAQTNVRRQHMQQYRCQLKSEAGRRYTDRMRRKARAA